MCDKNKDLYVTCILSLLALAVKQFHSAAIVTVASEFSAKYELPVLLWWKLGPRGVGLWMSDSGVCVYLKGKKKKRRITIQCVTVTAIHRTGQEWKCQWMSEGASLTVYNHGIRDQLSFNWTYKNVNTGPLTPLYRGTGSQRLYFTFQFALGKYKSVIISGPPLLWVHLNVLDFNRNSTQIPA